jgi:hypothetical protein
MFAAATHNPPGKVDEPIKGLDHPHIDRDMLPDDIKVYFTHGDLVPPTSWSQEALAPTEPPLSSTGNRLDGTRNSGITARCTLGAGGDDEWELENWPGKITEPNEDASRAFSEYYEWRSGCMCRDLASFHLL